MIHPGLPTTNFIHINAAVCVGTALSMDRCGKSFEVVALMDPIIVHKLLSLALHNSVSLPVVTCSPRSCLNRQLSKTKCNHQCKHPARAAHSLALYPYMYYVFLNLHCVYIVCLHTVKCMFASYSVSAWLSNFLTYFLLPSSFNLVFLTPHKPPAAWCNEFLCMCTRAFVCFLSRPESLVEAFLLTLTTLSLFVPPSPPSFPDCSFFFSHLCVFGPYWPFLYNVCL